MSLHYFTSCENRAQMGSCDCWEIWSESIIKVMAIPTYLRSGDHRQSVMSALCQDHLLHRLNKLDIIKVWCLPRDSAALASPKNSNGGTKGGDHNYLFCWAQVVGGITKIDKVSSKYLSLLSLYNMLEVLIPNIEIFNGGRLEDHKQALWLFVNYESRMMKDSEAFVSGTKKFVISEAFVAFERGTRSARPYQANKTHIIFKTSNIVLLIRELSTLSRWPAAIIKLDSNHANPVCFAPMQYRFEFHSLLIQNKLEAARVVPHIAWGCCERCKNRWLDTVPLARDTGIEPKKISLSPANEPMSQLITPTRALIWASYTVHHLKNSTSTAMIEWSRRSWNQFFQWMLPILPS